MRGGRLRHRVTVERATEELDSHRQAIKTWEEAGTYWAEFRESTGTEKQIAGAIGARITHTVSMRFIPGLNLTTKDRLVKDGRHFNVVEIANIGERNREVVIRCVEVPA